MSVILNESNIKIEKIQMAKQKQVLISEINWNKSLDGSWVFWHYCDGHKRIWERKDDGYLVISAGHRIEGYCIKGKEEKWKIKMLDLVIKDQTNRIKEITKGINEIRNLKLSSLNSESNND